MVEQLKASSKIPKNARVIVRCAEFSTLSAVHELLSEELAKADQACLAIHDVFAGNSADKLHNVPNDLRSRPETFYVHQFKLMEGIDDPRCVVLALYENFSNERQLVQQIGRIIRHPKPTKTFTTPAMVLGRNINRIRRMWEAYKSFDEACLGNDRKPPLRNDVEVVKKLVDAFPESDYIGGRFRQRVDLATVSGEDVALPRSCVVFKVAANFAFDRLVKEIDAGLQSDDRIVRRRVIERSKERGGLLSVSLEQSPLLPSALFADVKLHSTAFAKIGTYLFLQDSAGLFLEESRNQFERLKPANLSTLLPETEQTRITSLSALNADIGPAAIRSRTLTATSLSDAVPFMGDYMNFISRAEGSVAGARRYIGLTRARVRQGESPFEGVEEFFSWVTTIASELDDKREASRLFKRFSAPIDVPTDPAPLNILLDTAELNSVFLDENGVELDLDEIDVCADITELERPEEGFRHSFKTTVSGNEIEIFIRFDAEREKYILASAALDKITEQRIGRTITLTKRLNQKQAFRIIPATPGVVYAHGQFYSIELNLGASSAGSILLDLLTGIPQLNTMATEKGEAEGTFANWPDGSVFNLIDSELRPNANRKIFGDRFEGLVCDDLGDEIADFIAINEQQEQIAFIHAKTNQKGSKLAASALYDVCGQAVKNLIYLRFGTTALPGSSGKWNNDWKEDDHKVQSRIRFGPETAAEFRKTVLGLLQAPNTRREVWLVLGNLLSREAMGAKIRKGSKDPSLLQAFYLIMSTYSACKSVGADLRIFCSE
jgi:hypothetical protein